GRGRTDGHDLVDRGCPPSNRCKTSDRRAVVKPSALLHRVPGPSIPDATCTRAFSHSDPNTPQSSVIQRLVVWAALSTHGAVAVARSGFQQKPVHMLFRQ